MGSRTDIEWFYDPSTYWKEYGITMLGNGKWVVVRATGFMLNNDDDLELIAEVDDRKTAIGFLKLLKEQR